MHVSNMLKRSLAQVMGVAAAAPDASAKPAAKKPTAKEMREAEKRAGERAGEPG
jgi:hypothetical protein